MNKTEILILGTGCKNCHILADNIKKAVEILHLDAEINHITDIAEVLKYGIALMPAVIINGKTVVKGKVPGVSELREIIVKTI